jgi:RNA polymerase sigma-70 factor (ECF subfamily)
MQGRSIEDAELAERARDGDVGAYEELVTRYQSIAYRVAWLVARNAGDAEDAVQEAFVKAYFGLPRFRRGAPFKPWLLRIVANEAKNRLRSARRREALAVKAIATRPGEAARSPEDAALSRDDAEALTEALDRLNERDRLVIAYRYLLDMSEAEVAAALGLRRGTVKSRLSRAMTKLRIELGAEEMTG